MIIRNRSLHIDPPVLVAGRSTLSEAKDIWIRTDDGVKLEATFANRPDTTRAILIFHMLGGNKDTWREFQSKLLDKGFASLSFNWRGNRNSGTAQDRQDYNDRKHSHYQKFHFDAKAARDYMLSRGFKDYCIGIVGGSIGASTALKYAGLYNRKIPAIVLMSPGASYVGVNSELHMREYGDRPVFISYATLAKGEAYSAKMLKQAHPNQSRSILRPVNGTFEDAHAEQQLTKEPKIMDEIVDFLQRNVNSCH